jgi:hypothetical protein
MLKNYFSMGLFVLLVCQQKYLKLDKCFGVKSFVESVNGFNILRNRHKIFLVLCNVPECV